MLSIEQCRTILDPDSKLTDEQICVIRDQLIGFARTAIKLARDSRKPKQLLHEACQKEENNEI